MPPIKPVDIVVSTTCPHEEPFLSCRESLVVTTPDWVKIQILVDPRERGKTAIIREIMEKQPRDFIYLHDDMRVQPGWYQQFLDYIQEFPQAGVIEARQIGPNLPKFAAREPFESPACSFGGCYFRRDALDAMASNGPTTIEAALASFLDKMHWGDYLRQAGYKIMMVPIEIIHIREARGYEREIRGASGQGRQDAT